jgi:hypothetical protein
MCKISYCVFPWQASPAKPNIFEKAGSLQKDVSFGLGWHYSQILDYAGKAGQGQTLFCAIGFFFYQSNDWQKGQFNTDLLKQKHRNIYRE